MRSCGKPLDQHQSLNLGWVFLAMSKNCALSWMLFLRIFKKRTEKLSYKIVVNRSFWKYLSFKILFMIRELEMSSTFFYSSNQKWTIK